MYEISKFIQDVIKEYIYGKETSYLITESSDRKEYFLNEFFKKLLVSIKLFLKNL